MWDFERVDMGRVEWGLWVALNQFQVCIFYDDDETNIINIKYIMILFNMSF